MTIKLILVKTDCKYIGLIDSDGYYNSNCNQYEIILKSEKLMMIYYIWTFLGILGTKKLRQRNVIIW